MLHRKRRDKHTLHRKRRARHTGRGGTNTQEEEGQTHRKRRDKHTLHRKRKHNHAKEAEEEGAERERSCLWKTTLNHILKHHMKWLWG